MNCWNFQLIPRAACLVLGLLLVYNQVDCQPLSEQSRLDAHSYKEPKPASSENAYVTLLYGDNFLLGVRVLGQSLRESNTSYDQVVIVAGDVQASTLRTLESDGWRIVHVDVIRNPGRGPQTNGFPPRFWGVYSKLAVFKLTEYKEVVYIDADAIVVRNMDEIFKCVGFCACLRHSERFNTGVMKLEPSEEVFEDMLEKVRSLSSYTGGDQGFLNSYFQGFVDGILFEPNATHQPQNRTQYMRLPTGYNADVGLYVVNSNRWMIPKGHLKVIHYTFAIFKPWDWYTQWLIEEAQRWQALRYRLPVDSNNNSHGTTARQLFAQRWLFILPWVLVLLMRYLLPILSLRDVKSPCTHYVMKTVPVLSSMPQSLFPAVSVIVGYSSLIISLLFVIVVIPKEVWPSWGWILAYEWSFLIMGLLYGKYLEWCFLWGRRSGKGGGGPSWTQPPLRTLLIQTLCLACFLIVAPWVWLVLGIKQFVSKIMSTIIVGIIANTCLTHYFVSSAQAWYNYGKCNAQDLESV